MASPDNYFLSVLNYLFFKRAKVKQFKTFTLEVAVATNKF